MLAEPLSCPRISARLTEDGLRPDSHPGTTQSSHGRPEFYPASDSPPSGGCAAGRCPVAGCRIRSCASDAPWGHDSGAARLCPFLNCCRRVLVSLDPDGVVRLGVVCDRGYGSRSLRSRAELYRALPQHTRFCPRLPGGPCRVDLPACLPPLSSCRKVDKHFGGRDRVISLAGQRVSARCCQTLRTRQPVLRTACG